VGRAVGHGEDLGKSHVTNEVDVRYQISRQECLEVRGFPLTANNRIYDYLNAHLSVQNTTPLALVYTSSQPRGLVLAHAKVRCPAISVMRFIHAATLPLDLHHIDHSASDSRF
jgi:hypothetical protein